MKPALVSLALILPLATALCFARDDDRAIPAAESDRAYAGFKKSCAACHPVPDPAFAMDRAWLRGIKDTA